MLDLTTQAGLRSPEILDLRGSDVTARPLDTGERVALVRVHRRGKVDRVVPVISPHEAKDFSITQKLWGAGISFLPLQVSVPTNPLLQMSFNICVSGVFLPRPWRLCARGGSWILQTRRCPRQWCSNWPGIRIIGPWRLTMAI